MLNRKDAEALADQINAEARKAVSEFVMRSAELPPDEFEREARRYLEDVLCRTLERQDNRLDDLDGLMFEAYWRAMWREYRRLRAAGANSAGRS